jgi:hypothetical protein
MRNLPLWLASVALVLASLSSVMTFAPMLFNSSPVVSGRDVPSPVESGAAGRVHAGSLRADAQSFPNEMVSLTHNWQLNESGHWSRPEPHRPSVSLTLESWYGGLAELNLDMAAPNPRPWIGGRAFGFEAQYDGSYASLAIGGEPYAVGASGVRLSAGTTTEPLVRLRAGAIADPAPIAMSVERLDGTSGLVIHGGNRPHIGVALDGWGAGRGERGAALSFIGNAAGRSVVEFSAVGEAATLLASRPSRDSAHPAFSLRADGMLQWSDGTPGGIIELERGGSNQLRTSGDFAANGLVLGENGTRIVGIRVVSLTLPAVMVPRRQAVAHEVRIPDVTNAGILLLNSAAMPSGLIAAAVRPSGAGTATVTFVNVTDDDLRAEDGVYTILIIRAS